VSIPGLETRWNGTKFMVFILGFYNPSIMPTEYAQVERVQDKGFHREAIRLTGRGKVRPAP
jgi:hypothetical protein